MRFDRDALMWVPAGAVTGVAFLALLTIGFFLAPIAVALMVWAMRRTDGRGAYGMLVGAGAAIAGICLPQQPAYNELGLFGVACLAAGVLACVVSHRGATRTR